MDAVENFDQRPPVIVGYGTRAHEAALRTAGAERVIFHPEDKATVFDLKGMVIRADDTLLVAQPGLMTAAEYRELYEACSGRLLFQVIGHDPFPISTRRHFAEFRKIRPRGISETEAVAFTGRPREINYSVEQAEAILRLWHGVPRKRPTEIVELAKAILGLPEDHGLNVQWLKDLAIRHVGTARRDKPEGWTGINREEQQ